MRYLWVCLCLVALCSCTIGAKYQEIPPAPSTKVEPVKWPVQQTVFPPETVKFPAAVEALHMPESDPVPPLPPPPTLPPEPEPLPPPRVRSKVKAPLPTSPEQVIQQAERAAVIQPTERGYFAQSDIHRYLWQPNRLYAVYLAQGHWTKIVLPPGEKLDVALSLNPKAFDATTARVGNELVTTDIIFIRPTDEAYDTNLALVTEVGHSFDIRLVIGKQPMFAVTFQVPPIVQVPLEEQPRHGAGR